MRQRSALHHSSSVSAAPSQASLAHISQPPYPTIETRAGGTLRGFPEFTGSVCWVRRRQSALLTSPDVLSLQPEPPLGPDFGHLT